jgi:hypothetical protein
MKMLNNETPLTPPEPDDTEARLEALASEAEAKLKRRKEELAAQEEWRNHNSDDGPEEEEE